jgi:endonuclease G, mitochondrial
MVRKIKQVKSKKNIRANALKAPEMKESLRNFVRSEAVKYLDDPHITSVGIGYKQKDGKPTNEVCIQFTVKSKLPEPELEAMGRPPIPKVFVINGKEVSTDVLEREFHPSYLIVQPEAKSSRKQRLDTLVPGISVSHPSGTAGTLGAIVYDLTSGQPCMLSNWHVLHTPDGNLGDTVVQPGPYDDNRVSLNAAGVLIRSHLGVAGDCAIARIEHRGVDGKVLDLGVQPAQIARTDLGDKVVKSGRTTEVTFGIVTRIDVVTKINYGGTVGAQKIGGFEIGPDPNHPGPGGEVSMGGDSGSAWLIAKNGKASNIMVGLHFAGEGQGDPDEHAIACYAHSVFEKLDIALTPPALQKEEEQKEDAATGYNPNFLGMETPIPMLPAAKKKDAVRLDGSPLIPYTHFSVCLSKSHRLAHFVLWNIDGSQLKTYSRKGLKFILDDRIPEKYQIGDELYSDNRLDRGHLARRADLVWGSADEAKRANKASFFFTNITPQHQAFNQSERHGLWGMLENAILEDVDVENLRVSVFAGPIFCSDDPVYRDVKIPRKFWKLIAYVDTADNKLKVASYVLTQDNLLNDIEALELDPFRLYQVPISKLGDITGLSFGELKNFDTFTGDMEKASPEAIGEQQNAREIRSRNEVIIMR